eukprot:1143517-Pelagomonas_calceolata.AAC.11
MLSYTKLLQLPINAATHQVVWIPAHACAVSCTCMLSYTKFLRLPIRAVTQQVRRDGCAHIGLAQAHNHVKWVAGTQSP